MELVFSKSSKSDVEKIISVIERCFGVRKQAYDGIENGRYIVVTDMETGKIVGITGLSRNDDYVGGYEADYTCVIPEYRGMGVGTSLVDALIKDAKDAGLDRLYWSAWVNCGGRCLVEPLLLKFGFVRVLTPRIGFKVDFNCNMVTKKECVNSSGVGCSCSEDLWVLYL